MSQDHLMELVVGGDGALDLKVHYRGEVPNLISRFSADIQRRAQSRMWFSTRYERKLRKAARSLPGWARQTIQQHILQERAFRVQCHQRRLAQARERRAERKAVCVKALQRVYAAGRVLQRVPTMWQRAKAHGLSDIHQKHLTAALRAQIQTGKRNPELWRALPRLSATPSRPSLSERFAKANTALQAVPMPDHTRERTR